MNKAIVLLSGGLDSFVALDIACKKYNVVMALTFDYGQKAFSEECIASKKIADKYNIEHKIIKLEFLKEITKNSLTDEKQTNFNELKSVWVPNRNGLFLNIAACFCDSQDIDYIVFGANKEEGRDFTDNRKEYNEISNEYFMYSTMKHPKVIAPCCDMDKVDLVNYMIDNNLSFELIKSCYENIKNTGKKHCSNCMSCKLLYNAIKNSKKPNLVEEIF